MITTYVDSILPDLFLDLRRDAVSVWVSFDPLSLPKVEIVTCGNSLKRE